MFEKSSVTRFMRYAIVGVGTNLAGYIVYLLITSLGAGPKSTMTALYTLGALLGYVGNRQWAFRHSGSALRSWAGYCFFHAGGYLINFTLLHVFVDRLGYPHQWVQAAAIIVVACYLFIALNLVVFRNAPTMRPTK